MIRDAVKSLSAYKFEDKPHKIKLNQNESPYDLPLEIKEKALDKLKSLPFNRYPEMQGETLRQIVASYYDWPEDGVILGGGSNTIIRYFIEACGLNQRVLTVTPTFAVYSLDANLLDPDNLTQIPLNSDFSLPVKTLKLELSKGTGVFFIANPAAPTGNLHPKSEIVELVEAARAGNWTVVIDEAYHQFSETDFSVLVKQYKNVAVLRTFSKAFGLAGVRLGYTLGHPEIILELRKTIPPFVVSAVQLLIIQTVFEAIENCHDFVGNYLAEVKQERKRIFAALDELGVNYYPSVTNFFLLKVKNPLESYKALLEQDILVRRQDHLIQGCLRVSIGTPAENDAFLEGARKILTL